jgi:hypothetical protein
VSGPDFTRDGFAGAVGSTFVVEAGDSPLALVLDRIEDGPRAPGFEQYALYFLGPGDPLLEQRTLRLDHEVMGTMEIFVVPIGRVGERIEYQACFNHRVASG